MSVPTVCRRRSVRFTMAGLTIALLSCERQSVDIPPPPGGQVPTVTIVPSSLNLQKDGSDTVRAEVQNVRIVLGFTWRSSDSAVVRVQALVGNRAVAFGLKPGTATISVLIEPPQNIGGGVPVTVR